VRKNHTSKRNAFETVGSSPAFIVTQNGIVDNYKKRFFKHDKYVPKIGVDTSVALIKYHPGYDPKIMDHIIEGGCKAIIFEGTGLGHVGKSMYDVIRKARQKGVFVGMTSQCIDGRVNMAVYESGRDLLHLGIVPLADMLPEVALVKAMWASATSPEKISKVMTENIASELSDKI
jgi:glutamyl-tRNA(Gln) amidotransferase subunit D